MKNERCEECWQDRKRTRCGKLYREHKLVNGYRNEFEFEEVKDILITTP
jgi:hypothetical protein